MINEQEYKHQTFSSEKGQIEKYKAIKSISFDPVRKCTYVDKVRTKGEVRWFKLFWLIPIYKYEVSENMYKRYGEIYSETSLLNSNKDMFIDNGEIYLKATVAIEGPSYRMYYHHFDTNKEAKAFMDEEIEKCKKYGNNLV